jgi:hypothetical protein
MIQEYMDGQALGPQRTGEHAQILKDSWPQSGGTTSFPEDLLPASYVGLTPAQTIAKERYTNLWRDIVMAVSVTPRKGDDDWWQHYTLAHLHLYTESPAQKETVLDFVNLVKVCCGPKCNPEQFQLDGKTLQRLYSEVLLILPVIQTRCHSSRQGKRQRPNKSGISRSSGGVKKR